MVAVVVEPMRRTDIIIVNALSPGDAVLLAHSLALAKQQRDQLDLCLRQNVCPVNGWPMRYGERKTAMYRLLELTDHCKRLEAQLKERPVPVSLTVVVAPPTDQAAPA